MPAPASPAPRSIARAAAVIRLGFGALCGLAVIACSPSLNWRQVTIDGSVQALFPCRTETRSRSGVPLGGSSWTMVQTSCGTQGMTFAVVAVQVSAGTDRTAVGRALAAAAAANVSGELLAVAGGGESPAARASGASRYAVEGQRSDGEPVRVELLVLTDRPGFVYQAAVVGRTPAQAVVESFFGEFADSVRRAARAVGSS